MLKIAQLVPRHPGRTGKAKAQTQSGAGAGPAGSSSSSSSSAPIKKSGKKKR